MCASLPAQCGEMTNHLGLGEIKTALGDNGIEKGHRHGHTLVFTRAGTHARTQNHPIQLASLSLHTHRFWIRTQVHTSKSESSTGLLVTAAACCDWSARHWPLGTRVVVRMRWLLRDWVTTCNALCSQHCSWTTVTVTRREAEPRERFYLSFSVLGNKWVCVSSPNLCLIISIWLDTR